MNFTYSHYLIVCIVIGLLQFSLIKYMDKKEFKLNKVVNPLMIFINIALVILLANNINEYFTFFIYSATTTILVTISFVDLKYHYIPIELNLLLLGIGLIGLTGNLNDIFNYVLAFVMSGVLSIIISLLTNNTLGGGDIKLIAILGLIIGLKYIGIVMYGSFFLGAIAGVILMIIRIKKGKSIVPFAPFISITTLLTFIYGEYIYNYYINVFWTSL